MYLQKILQLGAVGPSTRPSAEAGHVQPDETDVFMRKLCDLRAILAGLNASCPVAAQPFPSSPGTSRDLQCQNQNLMNLQRWFIRENPIKMDDLGGTPIVGNHHILL